MRAATFFLLGALLPFGLVGPILRVTPAWRTRAMPFEADDKPVTSRAWRFEIWLPAAEPATRAILVIGPSAAALPDAASIRDHLATFDAERRAGGSGAGPVAPRPPRRGVDDPAWSMAAGAAWVVPLHSDRGGVEFRVGGVTLDSLAVANFGGWVAAFDSTGACRMARAIVEEER